MIVDAARGRQRIAQNDVRVTGLAARRHARVGGRYIDEIVIIEKLLVSSGAAV
jgi:hypothetical protein